MKKFLSIMLAVMMVLSTVSFAAPSAVGTMDAATEAPVVVVPEVPAEETADLAAEVNKASYGTLIYKVDFENDNFDVAGFSTAYKQLKDGTTASYINSAFDTSNVTCYTNAAGDGFSDAQLVTEGENTYITGNVAAGYDGFFRMSKYNCAWPEGYYTFAVDAKVSNAITSWAMQCNDTAIPLTTIAGFNVNSTEWQSIAFQTTNVVNGADMYGYFVTPNNTVAGTVSYDNWEVYYRPATVTLTIDGNEYEVSTDSPVSVASLASKVTAPTGYVLSGLSLTEGGELLEGERYYFEDTTLYPTFAKDPNMSDTYGKALFVVDFENAKAQSWYGHTSGYDNADNNHGAWIYDIASYYDARFASPVNYRLRILVNEGTHVDQETKVDADGNHYNEGTTQTQWPQICLNNWGSVTGEPGIYTMEFDMKASNLSAGYSVSSPCGTIVDSFDGVQGEWDKIVVQANLAEAGALPLYNNIFYFSLAAADKGVATFAFDNFKLYYKPLTADVTLLYKGEEYVAEDVSTAGVSADTILTAAGLEIPYGKKAVLSATNGGESVGNVINLVMDSTYYVSFVDDDSISEYGKRLFLVDFEDLTSISDNAPLSNSTSNFNGDWGHLTINYEVGANTIVEEDGNKIIKGTQGWAQIRINNANYASAPEGYYTMALKVKNYGTEEKFLSAKVQITDGETATWLTGSVAGTKDNYPIVNGVWNEVAAELPYPSQDFTIYHTAAMTTDVAFDDIALYYRPASVNLTVVDVDGEETVYENCDSVVDIDTLLADVTAPFGYKAALSIEKDGEPLTGSINLVSDAKLYVVLVEDKTVSMEYGEALVIIDFEREDMQGWAGTTQDVENSVVGNGAYVSTTASYYDSRFENKNYRVRFTINETTVTDQKTVVDANGNHYTTGTNTTRWPQVGQLNYGNVEGKAGYYTYVFDTKVDGTLPTAFAKGASLTTLVDGFCNELGVWDTIVLEYEQTTDGTMLHCSGGTVANFSFDADGVATISFDNFYYKPYAAKVELTANGAVVATKENVSTAGVLVSELVDGVKVKGYTVTGVKLGTETYGLEDTVKVPCDCQLELALAVQDTPAATPETSDLKSVRVSSPTGIRFKANLSKAEDSSITDYGWVVARADQLGENELTIDFTNVVVGYGRQDGVDKRDFYDITGDEYNVFTGVLYFSATEDDGLPSAARLAAKLVARPFAVVDGETLYGDATAPTSIYDVALALYMDENGAWDDLDGADQEYLDNLMIKVEEAGLGA